MADKDNFHSTRTLQSTSSLSLERNKVNTGVSTYNFCDAHVSSSKSCMTIIQTCTQEHSPEVTEEQATTPPSCMSHAPPATCTHWLQTSCRACLSNRSSFTLLSSKQRARSPALVLFTKSIPRSMTESHSFASFNPTSPLSKHTKLHSCLSPTYLCSVFRNALSSPPD